MKTFILLALLFLCSNLYAKAKPNYRETTVEDTLKKGKNYILFSKSANIEKATFSKNKKADETTVYIRYGFPTPIPSSNSVNATILQSNRKYTEDGSVPVFDKIDILKGKYDDIKMSKDTKVRNLFTLKGAEFPLRLRMMSGNESIDFELSEAGEWNIGIELKNN